MLIKNSNNLISSGLMPYNLINLSGVNGNFYEDSDTDGIGNGWGYYAITNMSMVNNIQKFTPTSQYGRVESSVINCGLNCVIYACAFLKSASNLTRIYARGTNNTNANAGYHTGSGLFEFVSTLTPIGATSSSFTLQIQSTLSSGWSEIQAKKVHSFNLTAIFGSGNEPTKTYMDGIMSNLITQYDYINGQTIHFPI